MRHHVKVAIATIAGIGIVAAVAPAALGALSHPAPASGRRARGVLYVADANGAVTPIRVGSTTAARPIQLPGNVPQLGLYGPSSPAAATANGKVVYVLSGSGTVTPIYTSTMSAGRPIRAASHQLTSLVVAPNGRMAYAVEPQHGVLPINLVTRRPGKLIRDIGAQILTMTPDGKTLYLVDGQGIAPIRTATDSRLRPIQHTVGAWAILGFSPDSRTLYLAGAPGIYAVSTATNTVRAPIRIAGSVQQLVMSANGKVAYALAYPLHNPVMMVAYPVNFAAGTVGKPISLPDRAYAYRLAITPDGRTLYMFGNGPRGGTLWPVRTATDTVLKAIVSGFNFSSFLDVSPDGSMVYAVVQPAHSARYYVVGISTATGKPEKAIRLGKGTPAAVAIAR